MGNGKRALVTNLRYVILNDSLANSVSSSDAKVFVTNVLYIDLVGAGSRPSTGTIRNTNQTKRRNIMTRKDYEAIAKSIKELLEELEEHSPDTRVGVVYTVHALVKVFEKDNQRFDFARFMAACGYPLED